MEKISELLKEAKPLYMQRKKTRRILKSACFSLALVLTFAFSFCTYFVYTNNQTDTDTSYTESYIETEMGLPTDDYGLLWIE